MAEIKIYFVVSWEHEVQESGTNSSGILGIYSSQSKAYQAINLKHLKQPGKTSKKWMSKHYWFGCYLKSTFEIEEVHPNHEDSYSTFYRIKEYALDEMPEVED